MTIQKTIWLSLCLRAGALLANPIQYSFSAPAITTGVNQTVAFSMSFTTPQILTANTSFSNLSNLAIPHSFNLNYPNGAGGTVFPSSNNISLDFSGPGGTETGSILGGNFSQVGTYSVSWQIIANKAGDAVFATLTIADLGTSTPEPSSLALMVVGLTFLVRRHFYFAIK